MRQLTDVVSDLGQDFVQAAIGSQIGGDGFFEVGKTTAQAAFIDFAMTVLFFVFDD